MKAGLTFFPSWDLFVAASCSPPPLSLRESRTRGLPLPSPSDLGALPLPLKRRTVLAIHTADPPKNNGSDVPVAAASKASSSAVATPEEKPAP